MGQSVSTSPGSVVEVLRDSLVYVDSWLDYRVWKQETPGAQVAVWFDGETLTCNWCSLRAAGATVQINNHLCPGGPYLNNADI